MEVKILGTGCPKCKRLEQLTREVANETGIEVTITKVTQMGDIMAYPIVSTPGLLINEEVKIVGADSSQGGDRRLAGGRNGGVANGHHQDIRNDAALRQVQASGARGTQGG